MYSLIYTDKGAAGRTGLRRVIGGSHRMHRIHGKYTAGEFVLTRKRKILIEAAGTALEEFTEMVQRGARPCGWILAFVQNERKDTQNARNF